MSKMFSILLSICCLLSQLVENFDPDVDICDEPKLNGAVIDDENHSYLFKGLYYWKTKSLDKEKGIDGFGRLTTEKWPEVKASIRTVFTVKNGGSLMTVFVVNNDWFGYQKGAKIMDGSASLWPEFKDLKITASFSEYFNGNNVFILHSNNKNYSLYDFSSITAPKVIRKGLARVEKLILEFLYPTSSNRPGLAIDSLLNVRAVLRYNEKLILISDKHYCSINLKAKYLERKCNISDVKQILGCPLDLRNRPTTVTTEVTTELTESTTIIQDSTICKNCADNTSSTQSDLEKDVIRKNSEFWIILFSVALIVIFICLVVSVIIISKFLTKRPQGETYFIK